jgi:hypothetical protein
MQVKRRFIYQRHGYENGIIGFLEDEDYQRNNLG